HSGRRVIHYIVFLTVLILTESACDRHAGRENAFHTIVGVENRPIADSLQPTEHKKRRKFSQGLVYVTKVVDGDTFWVDDGEKEVKVRFTGIDAPETRNTGRKKKGYFGEEARDYVKALTEYQWVRLETDVQERDSFKRLLAYVYLEDGTFLN